MSETVSESTTESTELQQALLQLLGPDAVITDQKTRELLSHDVFYKSGITAALIVRPSSSAELAAVVQAATSRGVDVHVRGGGMSYTDAYTPLNRQSVLIDMRAMGRVLEINETDMYVTVEAGCTWAVLNEALQAVGLRTPFWGPLSGLHSTIGGGLSQNNAFFGSSTWGTTSESLVSIKVVLADGTLVDTGSASTRGAKPFYRYYGPDTTGLFTGDAGALGVKAEATFRLMKRPAEEGYVSFSFESLEDSTQAMSALSRAGIGSEVFGFDPGLTTIAMSRGKWSDNLKAVGNVAKAQKGVMAGVKEAAKTVMAGKSIMHRQEFSLHVICEGRSAEAVAADLATAREIAQLHGGAEIDNSIGKVIRAAPFGPVDSMVGPNGERWVPTHGIVAHSDAQDCWQALVDFFEERAEELGARGISWGFLTCTMSTNGFLIEPVMIWPDALYPMHRHYVSESYLKGAQDFPPNPETRDYVSKARQELVAIFARFHAVHFQIGKSYPYREYRSSALWSLLEQWKNSVDPHGHINPGCLGFDHDSIQQ